MRRFLTSRLFWGIIFLAPSVLKAQTAPLNLLNKNAATEKLLLEAIASSYRKDIAAIEGPNKKHIAEIYKERYDLIVEKFTGNEIVTDEKASAYLEALTVEILKANSLAGTANFRVLFSKDWWPNASSMGEGTILFNIGLFNRLQNEAQAVFILCHELSHYYLNHGNYTIQRYVNTVYSKEFQKQLKTIRKSDYRQNQQVEQLSKTLMFGTRRHSREFEHAADSMAIELMKNTNYDLSEALSTLALLDSVDKDKYNLPLQLADRFNFASYPFKKSWLQSSALMFGVVKDEKATAEADSLKTHPDCHARILKLTETVQRLHKPASRKFVVSEESFNRLKQQFDFEILNYCFESKRLSRCLYYTLQMAAAFPDNAHLHTLVGKCLNDLYHHQKNHELGKVVDRPGAAHSEEYNTLLRMIQNLRLSEIAALSYHYLLQFQPLCSASNEFRTVFEKSKENLNHNP